MAFGSGLSGQVMVVAEATVGTAVTPTIGYEILSEAFVSNPTFLEGMGLKSGQAFPRSSRSVTSRSDVNGGLTLEHGDRGHYGLQWKHALGSTVATPTVVTGTAYKQVHTPGIKTGLSQTVQVGRPQTDGTVQPFTYNGVKTTDWQFTCTDNAIAQLQVTMDGWGESTATSLAAASYTANVQNFTFKDASNFKIGGTVTTSAGETTIASGVAVTSVVKGVTINGTTPMAQERYGLGNAGVKKEQLENAFQTITGSFDTEFTSRAEMYDLFKTGVYTAIQLDFTHFDLAGLDANGVSSGPNPYLLSFIFPAVKFKLANPQLGGPDIVNMKVDWEAYDDGSGSNPVCQVKLVSKDSTL
jgi:hypothetical protein